MFSGFEEKCMYTINLSLVNAYHFYVNLYFICCQKYRYILHECLSCSFMTVI